MSSTPGSRNVLRSLPGFRVIIFIAVLALALLGVTVVNKQVSPTADEAVAGASEISAVGKLYDPTGSISDAKQEASAHGYDTIERLVGQERGTGLDAWATGFNGRTDETGIKANQSFLGTYLTYADGSIGACFEINQSNTGLAGTEAIFADPSDAPSSYSNFQADEDKQKAAKALSELFKTNTFYASSWQMAAWYFADGESPEDTRNHFDYEADRDDAHVEQAWQIIEQVNSIKDDLETNPELLSSIKFDVVPTGGSQYNVTLTGSEGAIAVLETARPGSTVTINGTEYSVQDALNGVTINAECVNGSVEIEASYDVEVQMDGLYSTLWQTEQRNGVLSQTMVLVSPKFVHIRGGGSVSMPCSDDSDEPTTPVVPENPEPAIEIGTTATSGGEKTVAANEEAVIDDEVVLENLVPGRTYRLEASLMDKGDESEVSGVEIDYVDGQEFTATEANMTRTVRFTVPADQVTANSSFVAFERLYLVEDGVPGDEPVAEHEDIDDADQTVTVEDEPAIEIGTTASDELSGGKSLKAGEDAVVVDEVVMTNLVEGRVYALEARLLDKDASDGDDLVFVDVDSIEYVDGQAFVATGSEMTRTVKFTVKGENVVPGMSMVAFEKLYELPELPGDGDTPELPDEPVAEHEDPEDPDQTVTVISVGTTATSDGKKTVAPNETIVIVDEVQMTHLETDREYRLEARLMDKETEEEVPGVTVEYVGGQEFVAESSDVTRQVEFTVPADRVKAGVAFVAFEKLYLIDGDDSYLVGSHEDIDDADQTVTVEGEPEEPSSTVPGEPESSEPESTEPETTEPESTEPESSEPESSEPESTEPESSEPESTEPESSEPESTEPESSEPESSEPESSEPESSEPESSEPESSEPESTEPEEPTTTVPLIPGVGIPATAEPGIPTTDSPESPATTTKLVPGNTQRSTVTKVPATGGKSTTTSSQGGQRSTGSLARTGADVMGLLAAGAALAAAGAGLVLKRRRDQD